MKKHLILLTVTLSCGLYSFAQVSFGIKAGFSAANLSSKYAPPGSKETKADTKMIPAFHAGVIADIALTDHFSLQPGLFYSAKGAKIVEKNFESTTTMKTHLNYLELPVNFLYKHSLGKGKLFAGFGPYVAYGIAGKVKINYDNGLNPDINFDYDVKFKNKTVTDTGTVNVKPFDAGANVIIGYELNMGLVFSVNYSQGLVNTSPYDYEKEKNRYFGISVGYLLRRK